MDSLLAMIHNLAKEVADGKVKQAEMAARMEAMDGQLHTA